MPPMSRRAGETAPSPWSAACAAMSSPRRRARHSFTNYVSNGDATCTEDGTETAACDHPGCSITDTRTVAGSALGHAYRDVVTPPTCTEQGYTTHTCDRCGDTYVDDYTAPAGHTWGRVAGKRRRALADMRRVRRGKRDAASMNTPATRTPTATCAAMCAPSSPRTCRCAWRAPR